MDDGSTIYNMKMGHYAGKEWKECNEKMCRIRAEWKPEEWENLRKKLEVLSLVEVKCIATLAGMQFEGGIDSVKDRDNFSAKEQIILTLDEVGKENLLNAYQTVLREKK